MLVTRAAAGITMTSGPRQKTCSLAGGVFYCQWVVRAAAAAAAAAYAGGARAGWSNR